MRIRLFFFMSLVALSGKAFGQTTSKPFSVADRSANSMITDGSGDLSVGYARVLPDPGATTPSGVAIFGFRTNNVLVTEAGVPASPLLRNGRIYAEVAGGLDIGLAIANPNAQTATINFSFTRTDGTDFGAGSLTLAPGEQTAKFLDQSPFNSGAGIQGTFTFSSSVPIAVVALQGYTNERGEFLITTLPVVDTSVAPTTSAVLLPHFADGDGWSTSVLLLNPTDTPMSGTIQFRNQEGLSQPLTANGQTASSFSYTVARRSSFKLTTAGAGGMQVGSVRVTPGSGTNTPVPLVVFSYKPAAFTLTQAGVPGNSGTAFRMYAEASGSSGAVGSISTGVAIANASTSSASVTFDLFTAAGVSMGLSRTYTLAGSGQMAKFLAEVFPTLSLPFQGVLRITTSSPQISAVGLRGRYNERGDFLITTTPPTNEGAAPSAAELDFPHIVNGGGYTTQFVLFSGAAAQTSSGTMQFLRQNSSSFGLSITSLTDTTPLTLTSIVPTRAAVGAALTLTGSGFSSAASSNTVVFTSASGTVDATPSAASTTSLAVTIPSSAITGPVLVLGGGQSSSTKILEVTAVGGTIAPASSITVETATTVTGMDIYVPPAAGVLNVTGIGVGNPGSQISTFSSSAEISRSQTRQLLLEGTGMNTGSTVSVSGSGVTLSGQIFQNGFTFVTIIVDANAPPGARNVIVTNPNQDRSILSGGLFIR